jgi:hypothetical protein
MAFQPLPAYNVGNALNFSPLQNAVDNFGQVRRQNALLQYQQQRDQVSDQRQNALLRMQQNQETRAQAQFDDKRGEEALNQLAGIYQTIEESPEADRAGLYARVQPMYSKLRQRIPDFDADLAAMKIDPNDHVAVGKLLMGRARGYQSNTNQFGKTGAVFQDEEGNAYTIQFGANGERRILPVGGGLTQARGVDVVGDTVIDKATGRDVRNVAPAIAGGERAKVEGKTIGETAAAMPKLEMGFQAFNQKSDRLLGVIDRAISRVGPNTTGWGGLLSTLPGTEARALSTDLDTIKANVGFEELQAMRDASPTGGALGQVSEQENRLLQAIRGSLDQLNSGQNLAENLRIVRESVAQLKALKAQQFDADRRRVAQPQGQTAPAVAPPQEPSGPAPGTVMDGYRFKGGNPADPNSWEKQ